MRRKIESLLLILLPAIATGFGYWMVRKGGGPWWVEVGLLVAVAGALVCFVFLGRYVQGRRERRFVEGVVRLDDAAIEAADPRHREEAKELQDHWRESIEILRKSRLRRRFGNPLYALPWYLIIGESGSGKTTAVKNSNLHSPVSDLGRTAGISATRTCDWWFFEEAIILDTAGRYTIREDEDLDKNEWERFLALLATYRRQEPINGVIATVAADRLLAGDKPGLRADGQSVRRRIDQLMTVTGARFPVYVLVTKMDMVYGFTDTFLGLADEEAWQAAGYLDRDGDLRPQGVIEATFRTMKERLGRLRLDKVRSGRDLKPGVIVLENQFSRLRPGLAEYVKAIFDENPYQEKPLLRGVYFSSARQTAQAIAPFPDPPVSPTEHTSGTEKDRGLFLRDLFARILPNDRYLYTPISELVRWRWALRSIGFVAGLVVLLSLCALLSLSFMRNVAVVTAFTREFPRSPGDRVDMATNLLLLEGMRTRILNLDRANQGWLLSRFGLRGSLTLEERARQDYVGLFERTFQMPFDQKLYERISNIGAETDDETVATYSAYLLARLRLLGASLGGNGQGKAKADYAGRTEYGEFKRTCALVIESQEPSLPSAIAGAVPPCYLSYLSWNGNAAEMRRVMDLLQSSFAGLQRRHPDLAWVATEEVVDAPDVKPADFWPRSAGIRFTDMSVPGAYTVGGQRHIQVFLKASTDASPKARAPADAFWRQYRRDYYQAWYKFCAQFARTAGTVDSPLSQETAALMATDENPYWRLIHRAAAEMAPTQALADPPAWARLLTTVDAVIRLSQEGEAKGSHGAIRKTGTSPEEAKEELLEEIKEVAPVAEKEEKDSRTQESLGSMARIVKEYRRDMAQIAPMAIHKEGVFRMVAEAFSEQPVLADARRPLHAAYSSLVSLEEMAKDASSNEGDTVWQLFGAPLNTLLGYATSITCSIIEERWERDVWAKADGVLAESRGKLLFDKTDGLVPRFREGTVNPFLMSQKSGFVPKKIYEKTPFEHSIGFEPQFLSFLGKGEADAIVASVPRTITRCGK